VLPRKKRQQRRIEAVKEEACEEEACEEEACEEEDRGKLRRRHASCLYPPLEEACEEEACEEEACEEEACEEEACEEEACEEPVERLSADIVHMIIFFEEALVPGHISLVVSPV
jgi:hypothetical protein